MQQNWLQAVYDALPVTNNKYPMLAYGYNWLAFVHIVIAMAFIGPLKDPVKNKWIIVTMFHIIIDCSFGVIGLIPLLICYDWPPGRKYPNLIVNSGGILLATSSIFLIAIFCQEAFLFTFRDDLHIPDLRR